MNHSALHSIFLGHLVIQIQKAMPAGARVFRMTSGVAREPHFRLLGLPGHPDLFVLPGNGRIIYVEAKTGSGRISPKQLSWQKMCDAQGTPFVVAHLAADQDPKQKAIELASTLSALVRSWNNHGPNPGTQGPHQDNQGQAPDSGREGSGRRKDGEGQGGEGGAA